MPELATVEPAEVTAGDTIEWKRTLEGYSAADAWVLSYALRNESGKVDITATASGADHMVSVAASTSKAWLPGVYAWAAFATKGAERREVGRGRMTIRANLAASTTHDERTHAERVLDSIRAVLEKRATRDQEEFSIEGRSLKRTPLEQLVMLERRYTRLVENERAAAAIKAGRPSGRQIMVRFRG